MIWPNLIRTFMLLGATTTTLSGSQQECYIVFASENKSSIDIYEADFQLDKSQKFLSISTKNNDVLDNLFTSADVNKKLLYWKYKGSDSVNKYEFSSKLHEEKKLGQDTDSIFLGLGEQDQIYLYSPVTKILKGYDFKTGNEIFSLDGLQSEQTDMKCVDVDPRDRKQLFFAECSKTAYTGKVFDVSQKKVLQAYNQVLPKCFETWRITPDAKHAYAVKGKTVYVSIEEGEEFVKYHEAENKILGFAAGNKELFYTTKKGKLVKLEGPMNNNRFLQKEIEIPPTVNKMALHQYWTPDRYLIFAMEDERGFPSLYKSDFNLENKEKLVSLPKFVASLDKFYMGSNLNGDALYWSYINSDNMGRLELSRNKLNLTDIPQAKKGIFVGLGSNEDLYFFNRNSKSIAVTNFEARKKNKELKGMTQTSDGVRFMCRNPCDKNLAYFAACSETKTGIAFDLKQDKILRSYELNPSMCYDAWVLMPNARRVYAVNGSTIYRTNGMPFEKYYDVEEKIVNFAVGNNELFYTTGDAKKIFKLTNEGDAVSKTEYEVEGKLTALLVYEYVFATSCWTQINKNKYGEEFHKQM